MRKIKSYFFISLDGVVESSDKWHFPYFDDEMGTAVGAGFATADALPEWQNSEIVSGDVAGKLAKIKGGEGGDITMSGSATTVRWLLREGLLDELNLLVHPIVVGNGLARLFPPDEPRLALELMSAVTFKSGVLNLSYAPARESTDGE